jgi:hypothetical protein
VKVNPGISGIVIPGILISEASIVTESGVTVGAAQVTSFI